MESYEDVTPEPEPEPEPTWGEGQLQEEDVIQDSYDQGYESMDDYVHGTDPIEKDPPDTSSDA